MRHLVSFAAACMAGGAAFSGTSSAQTAAWVRTLDGTPVADRTFNSTGGINAVTYLGGGKWQVTLGGVGNATGSNMQVNAAGAKPDYCTLGGWTSDGTNVTAEVDCFNPAGARAKSDFVLFYQSRTTAPKGGQIGFFWDDQPKKAHYAPNPAYSFNSAGGTNRIMRGGVGFWRITVPAPKFSSDYGDWQVTPVARRAVRCTLPFYGSGITGFASGVSCYDASGAPTDVQFMLSFTHATTAAGGVPATGAAGYATADESAQPHYFPSINYTTTGARMNAGLIAPNTYKLGLPAAPFSSLVGLETPFSEIPVNCNQVAFRTSLIKAKYLRDIVVCYGTMGQPAASAFFGTIMLSQ